MADAAWDPDDPDFAGSVDNRETAGAESQPDEDEWGRVRWDADQEWEDEEFAAATVSDKETAAQGETRAPKGPAMIPPPKAPAHAVIADDGDDEFVLRKMKSDFEEMDLTPMVDCTFLLLIFFMITASFSLQKTIEVPPPNPDKQGAAQSLQTLDDFKEDSIIVEIDERNSIIIDDEPLTALASLPQVLSNKMLLEKKTELLLMAHEKAWHEMVISVIDAANEVGMQRIRMAAHGGSDE